jgi:hypothetical protein
MAFGVAELIGGDRARAGRQALRAAVGDRLRLKARQARVRPLHVVDHDGEVLEPGIVRRSRPRVAPLGLIGGVKFDLLLAQAQDDGRAVRLQPHKAERLLVECAQRLHIGGHQGDTGDLQRAGDGHGDSPHLRVL